MTPPIQLESISKCYRIFQNPQDRFKQALLDRFQSVFGQRKTSPLYREHWALRDVSFELQPGEAMGILGRNGAGKSTLLQIIAGTLEPTSGSVKTSGRITALLELGSGFNPEFTGRENVFLNAQILGMSREDALARFDDIASFADIGDFIDQPVKTYSSGMMMRLAFAVQTAVDPQVLIVDEALSVGDMFFQAKCMQKIRKLVDDGVSMLFVSHDIGAIRQICNRAVLLENGRVHSLGGTISVTDSYLNLKRDVAREKFLPLSPATSEAKHDAISFHETSYVEINSGKPINNSIFIGQECFNRRAIENRHGNGDVRVLNVQMLRAGDISEDFVYDEKVKILILAKIFRIESSLQAFLKIRTPYGVNVATLNREVNVSSDVTMLTGDDLFVFEWILSLPLQHGSYILSCSFSYPPLDHEKIWEVADSIPIAYVFRVAPRAPYMLDGLVGLSGDFCFTKIESLRLG